MSAPAPALWRSAACLRAVRTPRGALAAAGASGPRLMRDDKGKTVRKGDLPAKICQTCGRPFTWRKKWEKCWDDVKYCSDRCRNSRNKQPAEVGTPVDGTCTE